MVEYFKGDWLFIQIPITNEKIKLIAEFVTDFDPYEREPEDQDAATLLQHVLEAMEGEGIDSQMLLDHLPDSLYDIPEEDGKVQGDDEDNDESSDNDSSISNQEVASR